MIITPSAVRVTVPPLLNLALTAILGCAFSHFATSLLKVEKKANVKMTKKEVLPQLHGFPRITSENSLDFRSWWMVESWLNFKER